MVVRAKWMPMGEDSIVQVPQYPYLMFIDNSKQ